MDPNPTTSSEPTAPLLQKPAVPVTEKSSSKNCLFGCLIGILVLVLGVFLFLHFAKKYIVAQIVEYTDVQPVEFEKPKADAATVAELIAKFRRFGKAMDNGEETGPLVLDAHEINLLIHHHPEFKDVAGKMEVEINDDEFIGRISIGLSDLDAEKLPEELKGRYLNGEATFRMSVKDGTAELHIVRLKASGKDLPESLMEKIRARNLMDESESGKKPNPAMQNLEEFKIEDGKIWMVPKKVSDRVPIPKC